MRTDPKDPGEYPALSYLLAAFTALGPFTINTYLLAFPAIGADLGATPMQVQQTMTAYLATYSFMMLWHGSLSDALGRRRVILASLGCYLLATLVCLFAHSIEMLWIGRAMQGTCAGAGSIVGRAIVRDLYDGAVAQRLTARIAMLFSIAPAFAPIIGGMLFAHFGWRSIFVFLVVYALLLALLCWRHLPETLPTEKRQSLHPAALWRGYRDILGSGEFMRLALIQAVTYSGTFIYVLASSAFIMDHLKLGPQSFSWLFVPMLMGMIAGSALSRRVAGHMTQRHTILLGIAIMAVAVAWNLGLNAYWPPRVPWAILPIMVYNAGVFLAIISLQMLASDLFPARRGMVTSCQSMVQSGVTAMVSAFVVPLVWGSSLQLAVGMMGFLIVGCILFLFARAGRSEKHAVDHLR